MTTAVTTGLPSLLDSLQAALLAPTTAAAALPDASDLAFERTLSRPLARQLDVESTRILALVSSVLQWSEGEKAGKEPDGEMIREGVYGDVVERVEVLLERADDSIEKHLGTGKHKAGVGAIGAKVVVEAPKNEKGALPSHLLHAPDLPRPQRLFSPRLVLPRPSLDAGSPSPLWKPVLTAKPHALSTAPWLVTELFTPPSPGSLAPTPPPRTRYAHPYAAELAAIQPPATYFVAPEQPAPISETSFADTPFEWVGDVAALKKMVEEIRECGKEGLKDLAVDLEHHDLRSWSGVTCLIQLSTRRKDYVIDALDPAVRDALEGLNEFFADPNWIKVFHGAASDVIWLQRDFGLYLVGLFDTYHATHVLGYAQHSLMSLLTMYTDFQADKRYQLADWRIRPVPEEMLHYARSDTHFLLAIYDHLRLALHARAGNPPPAIEADAFDVDAMAVDEPTPAPPATAHEPLSTVFTRSTETASSVFEIAPYDFTTGLGDGGWRALLNKWRHGRDYDTAVAVPTLPIKTGWGPGELRLEVLRAVHAWREKLGREEDEGVRWVLSNGGVWAVVEKLPTNAVEVMGALGTVRGAAGEFVRARKEDLARVVREALERVTVGEGKKGEKGEEKKRVEVVGMRGEAAVEPAVAPMAGLWDAPEVASSVVETIEAAVTAAKGFGFAAVRAATSSFFGRGAVAKKEELVVDAKSATSIVAAKSSFFGGGSKPKTQVVEQPVASTSESKAQAVARVHASLVLGGGLANFLRSHAVPTPAPIIKEAPAAPVAPPTNLAAASMDHSYVPLSGRMPKPADPLTTSSAPASPTKASDVIIVSSLADKPKKRKSTDQGAQEAPKKRKGKGKEKVVKEVQPVLEPFDYDAQRSILDSHPEAKKTSAGGKKEKKKEGANRTKGFEVDTSDFRKTPRVNNQSKRGNVSQSFAK